jgi:hypothetical protein
MEEQNKAFSDMLFCQVSSPISVFFNLFLDGSHYPVTGQTTVGDALENALKRIGLGSEWSAAMQLFYRDHDGVLCRFTRPEVIPNQNEMFLKLFLLSPELLQILMDDKSFRKVNKLKILIKINSLSRFCCN